MKFIKEFKEISKHDAASAGGKGASLGEMTRVGIPVPPGFVILADAFEKFLEETDLDVEIDSILHKVNHKKIHTVENASEEIKELILEAKMPRDIALEIKKSFSKLGAKFVAVRSSATAEDSSSAAWAGQLESYLNTTEKDLLKNVQRCWASLFTPRAIFYRFEKNLHKQKISVAVVVQKMVQSEVSGVAFSVHPVTQDRNQLIIEAGFGLGEAIVSGQITPDSYVVEKIPRRIIDKNIATQTRGLWRGQRGGVEWKNIPETKRAKQTLPGKEILRLADLIIRIEDHYKFPCDIEWAFEKGRFYITQSRPITTLTAQNEKVSAGQDNMQAKYERIFSRDFCLASIEVWVKGESTNPKEWTKESQPFLPYVVAERADDTMHFYYDPRGVEWVQDLLARLANEDKKFLNKIEKGVLRKLKYIRPVYEKEKTLALPELKRFIRELEAGYPWFEAMWWYCQMEPKKLVGINVDRMQKIRVLTDKLSSGSDSVIRKSLSKIYQKFGDLSACLSTKEIFSGKLPLIAELERRDKGYFFAGNELFVNKTKSDIERKFCIKFAEENTTTGGDKIAGDIAQRGTVRGRVRRVMGHKQISQIKEGEILVSPMTMPDFLPAMKKAAAFVTDEGGVTCHAAIVARELKKPCIIGTKIATQVLKDGDLVEVDADKGVVKIIKK